MASDEKARTLTVKIMRYNPEGDAPPRWESFRVEADPMDRVLDVLQNVKWLHDETLGAFNRLVEQRRQRLDAAQGGLPGVVWFVLLAGAGACIVLSVFFHVDDGRLQAIMLVGLAASLAMVLLVIFALDTPFTGEMGIGPESYQLIYDQHMR